MWFDSRHRDHQLHGPHRERHSALSASTPLPLRQMIKRAAAAGRPIKLATRPRRGGGSALADRHREHPGVRLLGARMKLVGGDSGRLEQESLIVQVLLAPSERRRRSTVRHQ